MFGNFSKNPWVDKVPCVWDKHFRCFKAERVRIMIGHQFKFIANDSKLYLISNRYASIKDSSGNVNNIYDPRKQKSEKRFVKKKYIPHAQAEYDYNFYKTEH